MTLTKQDLDSIRDVVDSRLDLALAPVKQDIHEIKIDLDGLREQIQQLTITIDKLVKMYEDQKEDFIILKKEMDQVKEFIFEKFGVKIAVQR